MENILCQTLRMWLKIRAIKTQKVELLGTTKRILILRIQNRAQPASWINGKCCNIPLKTIADGKQEKAPIQVKCLEVWYKSN